MEGGDGDRGWREEKTFSRRHHGELTMRDRENGWGEASFVLVGDGISLQGRLMASQPGGARPPVVTSLW